jgi:diguanylate cyclase (GGDEF)-like protein
MATARTDATVLARPRTSAPVPPVALLGLAAVLVAGVVATAGTQAFWLCVPVSVAAAALCRARGAAALLATFAVLVAALPALLDPGLGPLPPALLAFAVPGLSGVVARFVRERLEAGRRELAQLARLDPLTGLPNRRALDDRLAYEVLRHRRHARRFAVVMLDLNDFKAINSRFGHSGGDELLRDVGRALRAAVREQDTVARLGGDEFCVLAPETGRDDALRLVERLRPAVRRATGGFDDLSGSVGCAVFPDDGHTGAEVMAAADAAQAEDKRRLRASTGAAAGRRAAAGVAA